MTCVHPSRIRNPAWGQPGEPMSFDVPCGRCMNCRIERSREWSVRLLQEMPYHEKCCFITLTYSEDFVPDGLQKKEFQDFLKRLRKRTDQKIKYFACGEYGDKNGRPHFHACIFGLGVEDTPIIEASWNMGRIEVTPLLPERINYATGYITKKLYGEEARREYVDKQPPFQLISKGLGKEYVLDNEKYLRQKYEMNVNGIQQNLPRYYKKVLDMPKEEIRKKAEEKLKLMQDEYMKKGLIEEIDQLEYRSQLNKQKDKNTRARISLKEKQL